MNPRHESESALEILLIEDNPLDARIIELFLEERFNRPFRLTHVERLAEGLAELARRSLQLVLLDLSLPDSLGLDTFENVYGQAGTIPIVVLSGLDDEDIATHAVSRGAQDFIRKGSFDADTLARAVRFAIERSTRQHVERELQAAETVQRRLYPASGPNVPGLDIAGAAIPAERTCGDYFDFVPLKSGGWAVVVGDVAGHGLGPALLMVETRAFLWALARVADSPGEMLTDANSLLADVPPGRFVSLICACFSPDGRTFEYASAGHPGYLLRGKDFVALLPTGPVLGLLPDIEIETSASIEMQAGDVLLLATDGIVEAASVFGEMFGRERMCDVVRAQRHKSAADIVAALSQAVRDFTRGTAQADDVALVVVKRM